MSPSEHRSAGRPAATARATALDVDRDHRRRPGQVARPPARTLLRRGRGASSSAVPCTTGAVSSATTTADSAVEPRRARAGRAARPAGRATRRRGRRCGGTRRRCARPPAAPSDGGAEQRRRSGGPVPGIAAAALLPGGGGPGQFGATGPLFAKPVTVVVVCAYSSPARPATGAPSRVVVTERPAPPRWSRSLENAAPRTGGRRRARRRAGGRQRPLVVHRRRPRTAPARRR